jgi:CheY-like chemotaxis protein
VDREILLFKINDMLGTHSGTRARPDEDAGGKDERWRTTDDRKEPASVVRRLSSDSAGPPCLLIVEDNPDNLTTIKAILQNRYRILEAADGEEGLRMASEIVPDLILLDMAMPKMDGFAVVRRIKECRQLNRIPVIAMTARVMKGDREMILAAGCDNYISKPIDPKDCLEKIAEYLKG